MTWGRAQEVFKGFHKEDRERISKLKEQKNILEGLREKIQEGASAEDQETLRVQERLRSIGVNENDMLATTPDCKEITEMVEALLKEKAPGEDGLMAEFIIQAKRENNSYKAEEDLTEDCGCRLGRVRGREIDNGQCVESEDVPRFVKCYWRAGCLLQA
ncbi:hypothetical protein R1sor_007077 [Riccia sorocarpa]|uniref:Uncharacterized protein n=1 Tax=Riccia sorocarpa TaxID=122646 RepID=A0ABD3HRN5_9MARC